MNLEERLAAIDERAMRLAGDDSDWARDLRKYLSKQRRAARMAAAREKGTHTQGEWEGILDRHGHRCARCGIPAQELIGGQLTKDHIIAVSEGGSDAADNLQPLCRNCNTAKRFE